MPACSAYDNAGTAASARRDPRPHRRLRAAGASIAAITLVSICLLGRRYRNRERSGAPSRQKESSHVAEPVSSMVRQAITAEPMVPGFARRPVAGDQADEQVFVDCGYNRALETDPGFSRESVMLIRWRRCRAGAAKRCEHPRGNFFPDRAMGRRLASPGHHLGPVSSPSVRRSGVQRAQPALHRADSVHASGSEPEVIPTHGVSRRWPSSRWS